MQTRKKIESFKDLKIWQKGIDIVTEIYGITESFPSKENFSLTSQMRRAAVSVPSNIAEGFKRFHNKEYKHFLHIALGSAAELETQLIISNKLSYIKTRQLEDITQKLNELSKMTTVLLRKLN